jgi:hypothetical protein
MRCSLICLRAVATLTLALSFFFMLAMIGWNPDARL